MTAEFQLYSVSDCLDEFTHRYKQTVNNMCIIVSQIIECMSVCVQSFQTQPLQVQYRVQKMWE